VLAIGVALAIGVDAATGLDGPTVGMRSVPDAVLQAATKPSRSPGSRIRAVGRTVPDLRDPEVLPA